MEAIYLKLQKMKEVVIVQKRMVVLFLTGIMMGLFTGCIQEQNSKVSISQTTISDSTLSKEIVSDSLVKNENITEGTDNYRGFYN